MHKISTYIMVVLILTLLCPTPGADAADGLARLTLLFVRNNWTQQSPDNNETTLGQSVFGTQVLYSLNQDWEFELWGSFSSTDYTDAADEKTSFSAINNTRLRGSYFLSNGLARLSLIVNLPTGKTELSEEEYLTAVEVSDNSRKFLVRRFGEGFDVGVEASLGVENDLVGIEMEGGYLVKGAHKVLAESDADYKFGNELYGAGRLSLHTSKSKLQGFLIYRTFGKDELDSRAIYQAGDAIVLGARLDEQQNIPFSFTASYLWRGKAKTIGADEKLLAESRISARNELSLAGGMAMPFGDIVRLLGRLEYKRISANEYEPDDSYFRPKASYLGFGGGMDVRLTPTASATALVMYFVGDEANYDSSGLGMAAGLVLEL